LDKQSRVVDFTLTERGRKLFAAGELDFTYYAFFDDGIDYDPDDASDFDERRDSIESTPMLEVPTVPDQKGCDRPLEPRYHVFTAAAGYTVLPHIGIQDGLELDLSCDQEREGDAYRRSNSSLAQIDLGHTGELGNGSPGFIVRVFSSGSDGTAEVDFRRDLVGRRAFDPFLAASIDSDIEPKAPARRDVTERVKR